MSNFSTPTDEPLKLFVRYFICFSGSYGSGCEKNQGKSLQKEESKVTFALALGNQLHH